MYDSRDDGIAVEATGWGGCPLHDARGLAYLTLEDHAGVSDAE